MPPSGFVRRSRPLFQIHERTESTPDEPLAAVARAPDRCRGIGHERSGFVAHGHGSSRERIRSRDHCRNRAHAARGPDVFLTAHGRGREGCRPRRLLLGDSPGKPILRRRECRGHSLAASRRMPCGNFAHAQGSLGLGYPWQDDHFVDDRSCPARGGPATEPLCRRGNSDPRHQCEVVAGRRIHGRRGR